MKIYDFSSQFSSKAMQPFQRQREKLICLGSPKSPDLKSSSSMERSSSFVSSHKWETLWRILLSRKIQDFFLPNGYFPTVSLNANAKEELKKKKKKSGHQSLWQENLETYVTAVACRCTQGKKAAPRLCLLWAHGHMSPHCTPCPRAPLASPPSSLFPPLPLLPGKQIQR